MCSLEAEIVGLKSQLQEVKSMLNIFHRKNISQCVVNYCCLYVSLDWRLEFGPDTRQKLQTVLGCPVTQAYPLDVGDHSSYKVKINKRHLWHALSSQGENKDKTHKVRLWKNSPNHHSFCGDYKTPTLNQPHESVTITTFVEA